MATILSTMRPKNHICAVLAVFLAVSAAHATDIKHRFLAKDESRSQLHHVNQHDPSQDWSIKLPKGCRDIRLIKDNRLLVSHRDGYLEYDLETRELIKTVIVKKGAQIESLERLADGRTILAGRKNHITFYELDSKDHLLRTIPFPNHKNIRLFRMSGDGHLLFGANNNHVVEADLTGKVYVDFEVPGGKHIYWIRKLDGGKAYRVSTGYGKSIVDITPQGKILRKLGGSEDLHFFSRPYELENGNIVCSHWTGHRPDDSRKGPQLIEYNSKGEVVWKWHDPDRAGTIHGVIILDEDDGNSILREALLKEFDVISRNIKAYHPSHWQNFAKVSGEALRKDAMILENDKTPVDVILRRTKALISHLNADQYQKALSKLETKNRTDMEPEVQKELFLEIAKLRREVAFSNPLLDFDALLFLKHNPMARGDRHMVDQYLGVNQSSGGGLYRMENPFSDDPQVKDLLSKQVVQSGRLKDAPLDLNKGSLIALDMDYDAEEVLFAYTELNWDNYRKANEWKDQFWTELEASRGGKSKRYAHYCFKADSSFHIFRSNADGSDLHQLTDGQWDDFDPVFLPSGRIAFISARSGGNQRCGWRYLPTYTLWCMMGDGSDVQRLSWHDTNEWHPSVNNDGMLVYTRWDYVDRDSDIAHHLWLCYPDGRDPRSMHGNYPRVRQSRPWMELSIRAIPDSGKYIAVAAPHHGEAYGSLIMIDQSIPDDHSMSQIKRITPLSAFPESEGQPGGGKGRKYSDMHYGTPWPLNEDFYLCVYSDRSRGNYGIYLVDSFGNRELLYRDKNIACLDPIPLKPRKCPPEIPVMTKQMKADRMKGDDLSTGIVSVMNVYEADIPIPEGVKIKELRIVNVFPKDTYNINNPRIGYADQSLARGVLGTVPVEQDGSAHFECPTGAGIYFQLLDDKGMMVQNMRSATYLHPGERLTCIGCHENKYAPPRTAGMPIAMKRPPSKIKPEAEGSYPLTFPRLVQPVLDKYPEFFAALYPDRNLSGKEFGQHGWSQAMLTLSKDAWGKHGGNGALHKKNKRSYSIPMQEGARVSALLKKMDDSDVRQKLKPEDIRRITLWLDCNSNFYGAYRETDKQAAGEAVKPRFGLPEWTSYQSLVR